jgi:hypothetical protein
MTEIVDLTDWLKGQTDTFETKKKLLSTNVIHTASGEKVIEGFRYFTNDIEELLAAFDNGDLAAIEALDFAVDEDGDPDTTSVCLNLAYTKSGAFFAAQPQEYQDYEPINVREPKYFTATVERIEELDQSS